MNIARTWAQLTTRAVKFETGNIADKRQAQAFEDSQSLLAQTDKVGKSMLDQDNSAFDLNSELKGNVYLNKQNPSNFTGHCTSDSKGISRTTRRRRLARSYVTGPPIPSTKPMSNSRSACSRLPG